MNPQIKCNCCRTEFTPRHKSAKYCSYVCRDLAKRAHINNKEPSDYYVRKFLQSPGVINNKIIKLS